MTKSDIQRPYGIEVFVFCMFLLCFLVELSSMFSQNLVFLEVWDLKYLDIAGSIEQR